MRGIIVLALAIVLISCVQHQRTEVKVVRVIDGDTIVVKIDGGVEKVRLVGIDCPEIEANKNRPFEYDSITNLTYLAEWGLKAKEFAERYLDHKVVELEFDNIAGFRDRYGRLLAYLYINGTDFNALLIKYGFARVYVEGSFEKKKEYIKLEEIARRKGVGLWGAYSKVMRGAGFEPADPFGTGS